MKWAKEATKLYFRHYQFYRFKLSLYENDHFSSNFFHRCSKQRRQTFQFICDRITLQIELHVLKKDCISNVFPETFAELFITAFLQKHLRVAVFHFVVGLRLPNLRVGIFISPITTKSRNFEVTETTRMRNQFE